MKRVFILLIITLAGSSFTPGNYEVNVVSYSSIKTFDILSGNIVYESTILAVFDESKIEWQESNGVLRKRYAVQEKIGSWSASSTNSRVVYEVKDGNANGTITMTKESGRTKVLIVMVYDEASSIELTIEE